MRLLVVATRRVAPRGIVRSAVDRRLAARAEALLLPRVRFRAGQLEDDQEQGSQRWDRGRDDQEVDLEGVPEEELHGDPGDVGELGQGAESRGLEDGEDAGEDPEAEEARDEQFLGD